MNSCKANKLRKDYLNKKNKKIVVATSVAVTLGTGLFFNDTLIKADELVNTTDVGQVSTNTTAETQGTYSDSQNQTDATDNLAQQATKSTQSEVVTEQNAPNLTLQEALSSEYSFSLYSASINIGDNRYTVGHAVDIASYQSWMTQQDFQTLKNLGIQTVVIKLTQGTHYVNPYAATQIRYAQAAGLTVAIYHYAEFTDYNTGRAEADYLANQLKSLNLANGVLIFADMETSPGNASYPTPTVAGLNAFWQRLNEYNYYKHGVYLNPTFPNFDQVVATVGKAWTWIAQYPNDPVKGGEYEQKWRNEGYGAWQFTSAAHIPGNGNNLDLSHDYNGLLTDKAKEGWQSVGDNQFAYVRNGNRVTGEQNIDGHWYYFDGNGIMQTGFVNLGTKTVYYDARGQMQYGEQNIDGHWYYFDPNTGARATGFVQLPNKKVYYDKDGKMLYGRQQIDGNYYYFNPTDGSMQTGLLVNAPDNTVSYYNTDGTGFKGKITFGNNECVFDSQTGVLTSINGKVTVGTLVIDGKEYYFNENHSIALGWQQIEGKTYYYDKKTALKAFGEQNIDGHWYYFDPKNSGAMAVGFTQLPDKKVYYNQDGQMQYGQQAINGHWYYFDVNTGEMAVGFTQLPDKKVYYNQDGQMLYGEQKIDNDYYFFNTFDGALSTGIQTVGNVKKYYDNDGKRQTGEKQLNGHWYYFDPKNSGAMAVGFTQLPDKKVYYNQDGQMQYGQQKIGDHWYYFDTFDGSMKTGFYTINEQNKTVYYGTNGQMQYGEQKIGSDYYYFDTFDGSKKTGIQTVDNVKKYYDAEGKRKTGQQKIDGYWYYFDPDTGIMATGITKLPDKTVYYNSNGQMQYGQQKIGGHWYYFDTFDGSMKTGFYTIKEQNKTVYYNSNGQMQYGWQTIGNHDYYFDTWTGSMARGTININGRNYTFSSDGVYQGFTERVANWFYSRIGKITYSMYGSRNGKDGTADCSGSITQALWDAGASRPADNVIKWGGYSTETIHPYLKANGYYLVAQGTADFTPQRGDIIIWGKLGSSGGAGGHIMLVTTSGPNPNVISTCGYDMSKGQAIKEFGYNWYWNYDGRPYYYVYRPVDPYRA